MAYDSMGFTRWQSVFCAIGFWLLLGILFLLF